MAVHVDRAETEAAQVEQLLQSGKAFSASGQWNFYDSQFGNAGVTLRTQKQQLALNEAARLRVADKKSEAQIKTLEKAQAVLTKYEFNSLSLTDKDWGDVVRWIRFFLR
jgi:Tfp pilus assembly protein FimV